jgi:hypothetical protein
VSTSQPTANLWESLSGLLIWAACVSACSSQYSLGGTSVVDIDLIPMAGDGRPPKLGEITLEKRSSTALESNKEPTVTDWLSKKPAAALADAAAYTLSASSFQGSLADQMKKLGSTTFGLS